jgi:PilZ domain
LRDQREAPRLDVLGLLHGEVLVPEPTSIIQISGAGMQVETACPLQLDSVHDFRLTFGDQSFVVKGRVAHSRISEVDRDVVVYRSGIEFVDASEGVVSAITRLVERIRQQRHPPP